MAGGNATAFNIDDFIPPGPPIHPDITSTIIQVLEKLQTVPREKMVPVIDYWVAILSAVRELLAPE